MNKGVTLLETVVVIGIIGVLSLMGINNINSFRREASLDNTANELVSMIKLARNMSMNGELIVDKNTNQTEDLDVFRDDRLPEYGIEITEGSYELIRRCEKIDVPDDCSGDDLGERIYFADDYKITQGEMYFQRITGDCDPTCMSILIEEKEGTEKREIIISEDFTVTINNL